MPVPVVNKPYVFFTALADSLDPSRFLANPTIALGDFQISKDGAAFTNISALPTVTPAGSTSVKVSLTSAEMLAEKVTVQAIDQDGEWQDLIATIDIPTGSVETINDIQIGDHTETSASLTIRKKGTGDVLLDKTISGSLLSPGVTIKTDEVT